MFVTIHNCHDLVRFMMLQLNRHNPTIKSAGRHIVDRIDEPTQILILLSDHDTKLVSMCREPAFHNLNQVRIDLVILSIVGEERFPGRVA